MMSYAQQEFWQALALPMLIGLLLMIFFFFCCWAYGEDKKAKEQAAAKARREEREREYKAKMEARKKYLDSLPPEKRADAEFRFYEQDQQAVEALSRDLALQLTIESAADRVVSGMYVLNALNHM